MDKTGTTKLREGQTLCPTLFFERKRKAENKNGKQHNDVCQRGCVAILALRFNRNLLRHQHV